MLYNQCNRRLLKKKIIVYREIEIIKNDETSQTMNCGSLKSTVILYIFNY